MNKYEIIRLYDDCGYEWGYFDLSSPDGQEAATTVLLSALDCFQEFDIAEQLRNFFKRKTWDGWAHSSVKEYIKDTLVYIEDIKITG